jgi:hypothetical protein
MVITFKEYLKSNYCKSSWSSGEKALAYAHDMQLENPSIKSFPEVEQFLLVRGLPWDIYDYCTEIRKGRWPEAESIIVNNNDPALCQIYVVDVINGRWPQPDRPKVETLIKNSEEDWLEYLRVAGSEFTEAEKWSVLKTNLDLEEMNALGMTKDMQEYFIQKKPHLIDKIENLNPILAKKYRHERELGNVDL